MNIERYLRQLSFKELNQDNQNKLSESSVAIVGLGGLGSLSSQLLARAGIGNLVLIDKDTIELVNLQRQFFSEDDCGKQKVIVAKEKLEEINSDVKIEALADNLDKQNTEKLLENVNLILDCTDNMETRFLINDFSLKHRIPWIYTAAIGSLGVTMNIIPQKTACFRCLFPKSISLDSIETCKTVGILNMISASMSSIQSAEAIKILLNKKPSEELVYFDIWKQEFNKIKVMQDMNCPACKGNYEYL